MAHCPYEKLADLEALLATIRVWPSIGEPKPGIFYFKRRPFLHFHIKDAERWADVRSDGDWERVAAPVPINATHRRNLEKKVKEHYRRLAARP